MGIGDYLDIIFSRDYFIFGACMIVQSKKQSAQKCCSIAFPTFDKVAKVTAVKAHETKEKSAKTDQDVQLRNPYRIYHLADSVAIA